MNLRSNAVNGKGVSRKMDRQSSITDPAGIVLVLGATAVMAAVVWLKAHGLPSKRVRDGVPRR